MELLLGSFFPQSLGRATDVPKVISKYKMIAHIISVFASIYWCCFWVKSLDEVGLYFSLRVFWSKMEQDHVVSLDIKFLKMFVKERPVNFNFLFVAQHMMWSLSAGCLHTQTMRILRTINHDQEVS